MPRSTFFTLSVLGFLLNGCNISSQKSVLLGDLIVQEHTISDFSNLEASGVFNLYLSQGDQVALRIEADVVTQEAIVISSNGDKLTLNLERNGEFFTKNKVNIYLTVNKLEIFKFDVVGIIKTESPLLLKSLQLVGNGVGSIELEMITKDLDAVFNLVGNITLKGEAKHAILKNNGVGNLNASEFKIDYLTLGSDGIGNVKVHSERELSIIANGVGKVSYSGDAKILKLERNGIGKLEKTEPLFKNKW